MKQKELESLSNAVMKRYKDGEISCCQAMEEIQALIMASETIGELELTHHIYDDLKDAEVEEI